MNALWLISEHGWRIAGWTMVYFLVIGSLAAIVASGLRLVQRNAPPTLRYATSLAVFAILAILPAGIAIWLYQSTPGIPPFAALPSASPPALIDLAVEPVAASTAIQEVSSVESLPPIEISAAISSSPWSTERVIEHLPWLWLIGTPLTFLLLATGLVGAERLRRSSRLLLDGPVYEAGERLCAAFGLGRKVAIAVCDRVATPLLVGIVRPLILLPSAALTGWSPDDLEMVLSHELAHVRRWDNLVNLLQRIVESLFFFHPAVWLASHWVRLDREDCCDAVVVARTAKPQAYAELLVSLASASQPLEQTTLGCSVSRGYHRRRFAGRRV
jgi:beta-lactamase regulating signal transducer with metallopeptidase domain